MTHSTVPGAEALGSGKQGRGTEGACALTLLCMWSCPKGGRAGSECDGTPGGPRPAWLLTAVGLSACGARVGVAWPPFLGTSEPHLAQCFCRQVLLFFLKFLL